MQPLLERLEFVQPQVLLGLVQPVVLLGLQVGPQVEQLVLVPVEFVEPEQVAVVAIAEVHIGMCRLTVVARRSKSMQVEELQAMHSRRNLSPRK